MLYRRYACLQQNPEGKPIWEANLENLYNFTAYNFDGRAHLVDAVVNHIGNTGGDVNGVPHSTFDIPVCISDRMPLENIDEVNASNEHPWWHLGRYFETWFFHHRAYFPFHCGDWKASQTQQFLNSMPVGPDSTNVKDLQDFYDHSLRYDMGLNHDRPLTNFLTLCETGYRAPEGKGWGGFLDEHEYKRGSEEICEVLKAEIADMDEIEATGWFCFGPTTQLTLRAEAKQWKPDGRPESGRPTHLQMCGNDDWREGNDFMYETFRDKWPAIWRDYDLQFSDWNNGARYPSPFRVSSTHYLPYF